ncbi:MAG: hypothetical protein ACRDM7_20565 [Thermoleophilaceae bacterium]
MGGPLAGLSFWSRTIDHDGEEDGGSDPDDDPPPSGDRLDWESFERDFRAYAGRTGRERAPA